MSLTTTTTKTFAEDAASRDPDAGGFDQATPPISTWLRRFLIGSPLPNDAYEGTRLPKLLALPVFSSDAISSVAYATQEILLALGFAGLAAAQERDAYTRDCWLVAIAIVALLTIVAVSYRQTIHAYPGGGGSYLVSKDNLGVNVGLVAAAALLIDYVLTVAVSVASGVQNLLSTPLLHPFAKDTVGICLLFVALLTLANLRGQRESGTLFAVPTYTFIALAALTVVLGVFGPALGWRLHPEEINQQTPVTRVAVGGVGIVILLRAFANGCSAMTGTEAISNGIPAFRKPETVNAAATLTWMALILGGLFLGITALATRFHVVYWEHHGETAPAVIDQISGAVYGRTGGFAWLYYAMQAATAAILVMAANTSFADFPRLASILATDGFLPHELSRRGDRLVFSRGILLLGIFAGGLLVAFRGSVDLLIPLYALGVFTAFTLSQSGMVLHWRRERGPRWQVKAVVNGLGAAATALVFAVILAEKGPEGAWMVVVVAVGLVYMFRGIDRHYKRIRANLILSPGERPEIGMPLTQPAAEVDADHRAVLRNHVVVIAHHAHKGIVPALRYARLLSDTFEAVYVELDPAETDGIRKEWQEHFPDVPLMVLPSPYRSLVYPLLAYVSKMTDGPTSCDGSKAPSPAGRDEGVRNIATVIIPEYFTGNLWGFLLQDTASTLIKIGLLGRDDIVVTNIRHRICV